VRLRTARTLGGADLEGAADLRFLRSGLRQLFFLGQAAHVAAVRARGTTVALVPVASLVHARGIAEVIARPVDRAAISALLAVAVVEAARLVVARVVTVEVARPVRRAAGSTVIRIVSPVVVPVIVPRPVVVPARIPVVIPRAVPVVVPGPVIIPVVVPTVVHAARLRAVHVRAVHAGHRLHVGTVTKVIQAARRVAIKVADAIARPPRRAAIAAVQDLPVTVAVVPPAGLVVARIVAVVVAGPALPAARSAHLAVTIVETTGLVVTTLVAVSVTRVRRRAVLGAPLDVAVTAVVLARIHQASLVAVAVAGPTRQASRRATSLPVVGEIEAVRVRAVAVALVVVALLHHARLVAPVITRPASVAARRALARPVVVNQLTVTGVVVARAIVARIVAVVVANPALIAARCALLRVTIGPSAHGESGLRSVGEGDDAVRAATVLRLNRGGPRRAVARARSRVTRRLALASLDEVVDGRLGRVDDARRQHQGGHRRRQGVHHGHTAPLAVVLDAAIARNRAHDHGIDDIGVGLSHDVDDGTPARGAHLVELGSRDVGADAHGHVSRCGGEVSQTGVRRPIEARGAHGAEHGRLLQAHVFHISVRVERDGEGHDGREARIRADRLKFGGTRQLDKIRNSRVLADRVLVHVSSRAVVAIGIAGLRAADQLEVHGHLSGHVARHVVRVGEVGSCLGQCAERVTAVGCARVLHSLLGDGHVVAEQCRHHVGQLGAGAGRQRSLRRQQRVAALLAVAPRSGLVDVVTRAVVPVAPGHEACVVALVVGHEVQGAAGRASHVLLPASVVVLAVVVAAGVLAVAGQHASAVRRLQAQE